MTLIEFAQWFTTSSEDLHSSGIDNNEPSENQDADLIDSDQDFDADLEADNTHLNRCTPNQNGAHHAVNLRSPLHHEIKKQPRFYTTSNPPQLLRQRLHARCISINRAQADTLDG